MYSCICLCFACKWDIILLKFGLHELCWHLQAMMDNNIVKVQVELHKEIKKNGSVRSLRAALGRFAQLAHMIRWVGFLNKSC